MPVAPAALFPYSLTVGAILLSPGPDAVLILRYTFGSGHRGGLAGVPGV